MFFAQDVSVPEAVPLSDLDESAIRSGHAEAVKTLSSASDAAVKATAMIEVDTYTAMARAIGVSL
jgi:F0F1-type ATP synthase epsilon subunit